MITSTDNHKLKLIRKIVSGRRDGLFVAEGEDLVAAGWEPEFVLRAGVDVEPALLASVSSLGSGTRVIGVYRERWSRPGGELSVYLHGVHDPGNVGAVIRSAHAFADGPVVLGPGCADPYSAKSVRATMGSIFRRPPARAGFADLAGATVALVAAGGTPFPDVQLAAPLIVCCGSERDGLPAAIVGAADAVATIPLRPDGPESLNVAMAATVALYERNRMRDHA